MDAIDGIRIIRSRLKNAHNIDVYFLPDETILEWGRSYHLMVMYYTKLLNDERRVMELAWSNVVRKAKEAVNGSGHQNK